MQVIAGTRQEGTGAASGKSNVRAERQERQLEGLRRPLASDLDQYSMHVLCISVYCEFTVMQNHHQNTSRMQ